MEVTMICGRSPLEYEGGVESHVMEVSKRLARRGVSVRVLSTSTNHFRPTAYSKDGMEFEIFPAMAPSGLYYFSLPLYKAIMKERCQILHAHGCQSFSFLASILGKKMGQKLFVTVHSGWSPTRLTSFTNGPYKILIKKMLQKADVIVGVSDVDLEFLGFAKLGKISSARTYVIPNGVEYEDFKCLHPLPRGVLENDRFVLSVARLEKYKGQHYVIESFAKLKEMMPEKTNLKLVLVGVGSQLQHLNKLVRQLRLEKDVLFLSDVRREELIGLYQKCELFVLLSQYESQGLSLTEAIAAGKPALATATSALKEYVKNGWCISVPFPPNREEVAKKMQEMLYHPSSFVPRNVHLPSWDDVTNRLKRLYEETSE